MNKQRKVLITITYNDIGIIIDAKAEEVTKPDLQPTCNNLATDLISKEFDLDSAIIHCEEVADRCAATDGDLKCEQEHRQLAEWLRELRRYKTLFESPEEAERCLNGYMV